MGNNALVGAIMKEKFDCLCAKHAYLIERRRVNLGNTVVEILGLSVPILYAPMRLLAKNTSLQAFVEASWTTLAALLLVLTIVKMRLRWQDRAQSSSRYIGENLLLIADADRLLRDPTQITQQSADAFLALANKARRDDTDVLGKPGKSTGREAYRAALKEMDGAPDTICPVCKSSPYRYKKGTCDVCGNTPQDELGRKTAG
jgi:mobilome CxxCx(11)CxxC protein